jgi:hypothetical protein
MLHAFSLLQDYMARHYHFLSLWHVKRGMAKTSMYQDKKNLALHNNVLQELGNIMHNKDGPPKACVEL